MGSRGDVVIRRRVADGLAKLNARQGGRYLSTVATAVGVDRTTVTRWSKATTTASVDHCRALARTYPEFFSEAELVELHARAALGNGATDSFAVGVTVHNTAADLHRAAAAALATEPDRADDRICYLTALHIDRRGVDSVIDDPHLDDDSSEQILTFRETMDARALEGWTMRVVVNASTSARVDVLEDVVYTMDGPDVEIRAYPLELPLVMAPMIVANRDVFIAYDHLRYERPHAAIQMRSLSVVNWATNYFDQLFDGAPFTLRNLHGPDESQLKTFRTLVGD